MEDNPIKILHLDLETAPVLAHVWGIWQQNVGLNQIINDGYILCWAAKWDKQPDIMFSSLHQANRKKMLQEMWNLLDEADAVVHYNGTRFDIPWLNGEFICEGMTPPSPYKQIDLLKVVKAKFRFPSNKLAYVAVKLGLGEKEKHQGHELWIKCMADDKEAWNTMETYNRQDVVLTEKLYNKLMPWITGHPVRALYAGVDALMCRCGAGPDHLVRQGYAYTNLSKFQQYSCKKCGSWFRGRTNLAERDNVVGNVI
jgi:hypothetical protein